MGFYLLPWSRKQSSVSTLDADLREVWDRHAFAELNPLRERLIEHFGLTTSPLAPAWRRYSGRFWEELSAWALPGRVREEIERRGILFSPLFGLLSAGDPVPRYSLRWEDGCGGVSLRNLWTLALRPVLCDLFDSTVLYDFLSSRDRRLLFVPQNTLRVSFLFYRRDRRVLNDLPHRAYTLRFMVERSLDLHSLDRINFLDYSVSEVRERGRELVVVLRGGGAYL